MRLRGNTLAALPFLLPALLLIAVVVLYPLLATMYLSLTDATRTQAGSFTGLGQYARLLGDAQYWRALAFTCIFAAVTVAIELAVGLAVAGLLIPATPGRGVARLLLLLPWAVPTIVAGRIWEWLFNYQHGLINALITTLLGVGARVDWLGSLPAVYFSLGIADVWKTTPYVIFLSLAALLGLDRDVLAAARLDGASPRVIVWRIVLPLIGPALLVIAAFRVIDAFRVFDLIYILSHGAPGGATTSVSLLAYQQLFVAGDIGYASAIACASFLLFVALAVWYLRLFRRTRSFRAGAP